MSRTRLFIFCYLLLVLISGCSTAPPSKTQTGSTSAPALRPLDPQEIQSRIMSFADQYMASMADAYDQLEANSRTIDARIMAQRCKIYAGMGAMGNAVDPNPVAGMMDMALMVTITTDLTLQPWFSDMFGRDNTNTIINQLKQHEGSIWTLVSDYLTPAQVSELHDLATEWLADHPDQRFVAGARLAELPQNKSKNKNNLSVQGLAGSVFSLIHLDPFQGLDPAIQQVEQSRVLAERAFFYFQHLPLLLGWQMDLLYSRMLSDPQMQQLFQNTTAVSGATTTVSDSTARFATTIENFRRELPQLVASQRSGALDQATTQISSIRDTTVDQLNASLQSQQNALTQNLQAVMNDSIDRAYAHVRSLIIIAGCTILAILVCYRLIARYVLTRKRP